MEFAKSSPISLKDVVAATSVAIEELDRSFFRVRYDRLTPREKRFLRAMAQIGQGPMRSSDVADIMGIKVTSIGPTRSTLIKKGMIYSPAYGDLAFTVPMFDGFMKRAIRDSDWKPGL